MTVFLTKSDENTPWIVGVTLVWAAMMLQADLKVSVPYIHWVVTGLAVFAITPYLLTVRSSVKFPPAIPGVLFVAAVCIPTFYGAQVGYSLAEAGKLTLLLGGLAIFVRRSELAHYAFRGFVIAVWLNLLLLLGGMLGTRSATVMSAGRWGTIFNFPGSLSRLGIAVFVYAGYLAVKNRSWKFASLAAASTALVYFDGSRTSLLLLLAGGLYLTLVLGAEANRLKLALAASTLGVLAVVAAAVHSGAVAGEVNNREQGGLERLQGVAGSMQEGVAGLQAADVSRFRMIQDGVEAVQAHPVLGTGILTTMSETLVGPMVIHMTYLQVWADIGLLGLISFIWLTWGWVRWVPLALRRIRGLSDPVQKAGYHNAIFLLLFNGMAACLHPLSTEWSEWILFIVPYALVWEISRPKRAITVIVRMVESYA